MLGAPVRAAPNSLRGQLEYIRTRWAHLLGDLLLRLLTGMDVLRRRPGSASVPSPGPPRSTTTREPPRRGKHSAGQGLDAPRRHDCEEHPRVAGPALAGVQPEDPAP